MLTDDDAPSLALAPGSIKVTATTSDDKAFVAEPVSIANALITGDIATPWHTHDRTDPMAQTTLRRCQAHAKSTGGRCRKPVRAGATVCYWHGGAAPQVKVKADERAHLERARRAAETLGSPADVDPHDALLQEVHRTAGHVAWLAGIVAQLQRDELVRGITKTVYLPDGSRRVEAEAAVNIWVRLYQAERDHLRRVSVDAIRAGVEERRVELEAQTAHELAERVRMALVDLGIDPTDPRVRRVVRLRLIEGGSDAPPGAS